jgi:hypothetical protein
MRKTGDEIMSVIVTGEYVTLLDPSHDNVLKDIRNVYTG